MTNTWRQSWRVAGRESGSPELLGSPRTSPEVPRTSPEVFGDFPGSSLTVELTGNPEVPRKFPKLPRKFPKLPRKFRDFPGGRALSLGSLTPSPDSQKLRKRQFVHKIFVHNFVPLNPPPPNRRNDGFPLRLEFLLKGAQTELRTLSQNCEETLRKLRTNRIMNNRAFLKTFSEIPCVSKSLNLKFKNPSIM